LVAENTDFRSKKLLSQAKHIRFFGFDALGQQHGAVSPIDAANLSTHAGAQKAINPITIAF
jgi:hypothetical protein